MPTLPTLTVTQAQADRMLAAYGSQSEYTSWLKNAIIDFVIAKENQADSDAFYAQQQAKATKTKTDLT